MWTSKPLEQVTPKKSPKLRVLMLKQFRRRELDEIGMGGRLSPWSSAVLSAEIASRRYTDGAGLGYSGDLGARQSIYPTRLFTLPVTSDALAGWPMLYGSAAMVLLWAATRTFALWPADVPPPFETLTV